MPSSVSLSAAPILSAAIMSGLQRAEEQNLSKPADIAICIAIAMQNAGLRVTLKKNAR